MTEALSAGARGVRGGHVPVLLGEVLEILAPRDGGIYVDGTFGAGGYSRALLEAARCTVWGIDRDRSAAAHGAERRAVTAASSPCSPAASARWTVCSKTIA